MNQARLYVSVFIDNSPSMPTKTLNQLIQGFRELLERFTTDQQQKLLQIQIMTYQNFQPVVSKTIDETNVMEEPLKDGFPLLGRGIDVMAKDLIQALNQETEPIHTPWVIVISNGLSLDSLGVSHPSLKMLKDKFNLRYLPFLTTREKLATRQIDTEQFESKKPMVILDQKMDLFFHWLSEDIHNRIVTPIDERVKSDKKLLEGWTIL
jgi:uncharacterized protein YegL